ncbi:hypothetical protein C8R46DRAFT_1058200, partial [Mycena filopes]
MGIVTKWSRKRPLNPGSPSGSSADRDPEDENSGRPGVRRHRVEHRLTLVPDAAALAAKMLLIACDAPVLSVLKPVAGFSDLICRKLQIVRSYKEALNQLERQAALVVENIIDNIGDEVSPQSQPILHELFLILDEVALSLDDADAVVTGATQRKSKHSKLRLWLIAGHELDRVRDLSYRLRDAVSVLGVATALEFNRSSSHPEFKPPVERAAEPAVNRPISVVHGCKGSGVLQRFHPTKYANASTHSHSCRFFLFTALELLV